MTTFTAVFVKCKVGKKPNVFRVDQELEVNSCSGMLVHPLSLWERAPSFNTNKISKPREGGKHNAEGHVQVRGGDETAQSRAVRTELRDANFREVHRPAGVTTSRQDTGYLWGVHRIAEGLDFHL